MYPFEVWDENTQRIEFYWNRWAEYKNQLFAQYPVNDHPRVTLSLYFPSERLEDVWVHNWNPHHEMGNHHLTVYDCFYDNSEWSTIFEIYPCHDHNHPEAIRFFAEQGHTDPWGEPIRIMSTSSDIYDDHAHRFAYFRGRYWKIIGFLAHHRPRWWQLWLPPTEQVRVIDWDFLQTFPLWNEQISPEYREVVNWSKEGF